MNEAQANRVLNGQLKVELSFERSVNDASKTKNKKTQLHTLSTDYSHDLYAALAQLRSEIAAKEQIAPYLIFTKDTLEDIAKRKPTNLKDLESCSGVGRIKLKKYGALIIERVQTFLNQKGTPPMKIDTRTSTKPLKFVLCYSLLTELQVLFPASSKQISHQSG